LEAHENYQYEMKSVGNEALDEIEVLGKKLPSMPSQGGSSGTDYSNHEVIEIL
jgi:hypothetical protein